MKEIYYKFYPITDEVSEFFIKALKNACNNTDAEAYVSAPTVCSKNWCASNSSSSLPAVFFFLSSLMNSFVYLSESNEP